MFIFLLESKVKVHEVSGPTTKPVFWSKATSWRARIFFQSLIIGVTPLLKSTRFKLGIKNIV